MSCIIRFVTFCESLFLLTLSFSFGYTLISFSLKKATHFCLLLSPLGLISMLILGLLPKVSDLLTKSSGYYSAMFTSLPQKEISGFLTFMWKVDPFKAKWSVLAKAYSIIRDHQGKLNDKFFVPLVTHENVTYHGLD